MNRFTHGAQKAFHAALGLLLLAALTAPLPAWSAAERKSSAAATQKSSAGPAAQRRPADVGRSSANRTSTRSPAAQRKTNRSSQTATRRSPPAASPLRVAAGPRMSVAERMGLRAGDDPLNLSASVALVIDQETNEVLISMNDDAVLPIASLTKLMAGLVIADAGLSMTEMITITRADVDTARGSSSRLAVGTRLSREELLHLSLMSSENRAAHALGRTFPGGMQRFVRQMNAKASELGMQDTRFVEPTGLFSENQSTARDLATLVAVAYQRPILRNLSTSPAHQVESGPRVLQFNNSNRLIRNAEWEIGLQKTGFISDAGRCLVMQVRVAGRQLIMVFLDASSTSARVQDAERVRRWVEAQRYLEFFTGPRGGEMVNAG